jgi:chromosome segregation ATPase
VGIFFFPQASGLTTYENNIHQTEGEKMMALFNRVWGSLLGAATLCAVLSAAPARLAADDQPANSPSSPDRGRVEQQLRSIKEKIGQLEKEGRQAEAERLKDEARAIHSKFNLQANVTSASSDAQREQLRQQLQAIHEKIAVAEKEGNQGDAQRLREFAEAMQAKLHALGGSPTIRPASSDSEARLRHLRSAAENLMAAGFQPEAQHVMQMIQKMEAEGREEAARRDVKSAPADLSRVMHELHDQIEQLHREVRELRDQLNDIKTSQRH